MGLTLTGRPVAAAAAGARAGHRQIGPLALTGVVLASFGGPLVLAGQLVPGLLTDSAGRAGFVTLAAAAVFLVPFAVWLGYARRVAGAGGLYGFVRQAAGTRVAAAQAGLWIASYALYLLSTTAAIVYDVLPAVAPATRNWQPALALGIPAALAAVMLAGRRVTVIVLAAVGAGQLALTIALAAVASGHGAPASALVPTGPAGGSAAASGQIALLFVCGSLPLFLGGEVRRPTRTLPLALVAGFVLTAAAVTAAVVPLAANPAFTHVDFAGVAEAQVFAGHGFALTVGIGIAVGTGALMLVEFLALSRLLHAVTGRPQRSVTRVMAAVLLATAPLTLLSPRAIYEDLLAPSLVLLWASQLLVFVCYPLLRARRRALPAALALAASAFAGYGIYAALTAGAS